MQASELYKATKWFVPKPCFSTSLIVDVNGVPPCDKAQEATNVAEHVCKLFGANRSIFAALIDVDRLVQRDLTCLHDAAPRHAETIVGQFAQCKQFAHKKVGRAPGPGLIVTELYRMLPSRMAKFFLPLSLKSYIRHRTAYST